MAEVEEYNHLAVRQNRIRKNRMKRKILAGLIVLLFLGIPLICLILPIKYSTYLMEIYILTCLLGYFCSFFYKPQDISLIEDEVEPLNEPGSEKQI